MQRQRYIVPSATQTAVQIDTMSNLTDIEFSDASGPINKSVIDQLASMANTASNPSPTAVPNSTAESVVASSGKKAKKTPFKNLVANAKSKVAKMASNRQTKRDNRQRQKMIAAEGDLIRLKNMQLLLEKNQNYILPVEKAKAGIATPAEEQLADQVIDAANEMKATGAESAPLLGTDIPPASGTPGSGKTTDDKKGWKNLSTTAKVGIVGGSAIVLGIIIYAVSKSGK